MRWKKTLNFIVAVILSIVYFYVALLYLIGTLPFHTITIQGPAVNLLFSFIYLSASLIISWGIYFYVREKPGKAAFFTSILIGIGLILVGLFLWKITK